MSKSSSGAAVPGAPDTTEDTPDGQRALRLHAGIATIATVLCLFVAAVFVHLGNVPLGVAFAAIAVLCLGALGWAMFRKRRGARSR
jgi:Flp pilus assembly protein TadB